MLQLASLLAHQSAQLVAQQALRPFALQPRHTAAQQAHDEDDM